MAHLKNFLLWTCALFGLNMYCAQAQEITTLQTINGTPRFVQNGKPYIMFAGELLNSSASTPMALRAELKTAKAMGYNTVLAPVEWDLIEPEENQFNWASVDTLIQQTTAQGLRLGVLWFGLWKNGDSSYPPIWVKQDFKRFFRSKNANGRNSTTISPFCQAAIQADAKAYAKLLEHIKAIDTQHTVSVIQVENEVGVFTDHDHSAAGEKAFKQNVPAQLLAYLTKNKDTLNPTLLQHWKENGFKQKGNWVEIFGNNEDTHQFFMSWAYACAIEQIAHKGKQILALPTYINCWRRNGSTFGHFPSGGPQDICIDIFKAFAPSIDIIAPDVYDPQCYSIYSAYHRQDNPLFIPETFLDAGAAYYAYGEHNAICYSPFGIEQAYDDPYLLGENEVLNELLPMISQYQGTGKMHGFVRQEGINKPNDTITLEFEDYIAKVAYIAGEKFAHGLAIQTARNEFLFAGVGATVKFFSKKNKTDYVKVGYEEELIWKDNQWTTLFVLNGDENGHGNMLYLRGRMPMKDYDFGGKKIPAPIFSTKYQQMKDKPWQDRFKVSGVYKIKLFSYPER